MSLIFAFHELAKINRINLRGLEEPSNIKAEMKKSKKVKPVETVESVDPRLSLIYSQIPFLVSMAKNWDLKTMLRLEVTSPKHKELMEPIIKKKKEELQSYVEFLNNLDKNYSLEKLDQTEVLYLDHNQLTSVPNFNLPKLQILDLSSNQLTTVPNFNLPNLQHLSISYNQLTTVPDFNLPRLQTLYLRNNRFSKEEKERLREKYKDITLEL